MGKLVDTPALARLFTRGGLAEGMRGPGVFEHSPHDQRERSSFAATARLSSGTGRRMPPHAVLHTEPALALLGESQRSIPQPLGAVRARADVANGV
jgi:hypothetical protein